MESITYTVAGKEFEIQHHGVKGMKWGKRKARPEAVGVGRQGGKAANDSPEAEAAAKAARRQKAKRAIAIGGAVVGTALAAYGTYKIAKMVKQRQSGKVELDRFFDTVDRVAVSRVPVSRVPVSRIDVPRTEVGRVKW